MGEIIDILRDKMVFHEKYGIGRIVDVVNGDNSSRLIVSFANKDTKFSFPSCFLDEFLTTDDPELLSLINNYEGQLIYNYLSGREVKSLIHFTVSDNLSSIFEKGIIPRDQLDESAYVLDEQRLDGECDGSCFTLSFPNYKMFYKYRTTSQDKTFVILGVKIDYVQALRKEQIAFYPANAAMTGLRDTFETHQGIESLKKMFSDHPLGCKDNYHRSESNLPDCYTTNPQAEVIIKATVPPEYIWRVYVESQSDARKVKRVLEEEYHDIVQVYPELFDHRMDYIWW